VCRDGIRWGWCWIGLFCDGMGVGGVVWEKRAIKGEGETGGIPKSHSANTAKLLRGAPSGLHP